MLAPGLFKGKRILVTGGGTGLGRGMAERLAALGADLVLCGRRPAPLLDTKAEFESRYGVRVATHTVDIRDAQSVEAMVEALWADGPLTGLLNNAAGNFISRTEDLSPRGFDAIANIVLHGTFYVTQSVGRRWIAERRRGSVVTIVTTWVWTGSPFVVPSAMSKAGLDAMTKSLAIEWGRHGIRLNAIAPGVIPTEGAQARLDPKGDAAERGMANPMGRVGEMHEIANLAGFLLADGCDWLTGQTIALDGAGHLGYGAQMTRYFALDDAGWADMRARIKAANDKDRAARS